MFLGSRIASASDEEANELLVATCVSEEIGLGIEILASVPQGSILDRFTGDIGPAITQHSLQVAPGVHISNTRFIGYLSHGCDPNCRLDMDRFELIALRDIAAGELLTIDYAETEDVLHVQFACHCGAAACRHWITGREDTINSAGLDYLAIRAERV